MFSTELSDRTKKLGGCSREECALGRRRGSPEKHLIRMRELSLGAASRLARAAVVLLDWLATGERAMRSRALDEPDPLSSPDERNSIDPDCLEDSMESIEQYCVDYDVSLYLGVKVHSVVLVYDIFQDIKRFTDDGTSRGRMKKYPDQVMYLMKRVSDCRRTH